MGSILISGSLKGDYGKPLRGWVSCFLIWSQTSDSQIWCALNHMVTCENIDCWGPIPRGLCVVTARCGTGISYPVMMLFLLSRDHTLRTIGLECMISVCLWESCDCVCGHSSSRKWNLPTTTWVSIKAHAPWSDIPRRLNPWLTSWLGGLLGRPWARPNQATFKLRDS